MELQQCGDGKALARGWAHLAVGLGKITKLNAPQVRKTTARSETNPVSTQTQVFK